LLGRTVSVDSNTSFGGRVHGLADILPNDLAIVQANAVSGVLVASSVLVVPPLPKAPAIIHGTVKSIGTEAWVITDSAHKDWTVVVNAQTKIIGDPRVGDPVEILANTDNANQYVAVSIMKSLIAERLALFTGTLKSITGSTWLINTSGRDVSVTVNAQTKITGDPRVNDGVAVTASVDAAGNYTAIAIAKLGIVPPVITMTLNGVVKSVAQHMTLEPCPSWGCIIATWTIGPAVGLGPDFLVAQTENTKVAGSPKTGDLVEVVVQQQSGALVALSISRK
jgi:hypothetical protein